MRVPSKTPESIADNIFRSIAQTFPVACASDEFFYFPHIKLTDPDWSAWDLFSSETIADMTERLSSWESEVDQVSADQHDISRQIDLALLKKFISTIKEQLSVVRFWEIKPTFYLSIACIGLAEALESKNPEAIYGRIKGLPSFLDRACLNLKDVPLLFRDICLEMVSDTRNYFVLLNREIPEFDPAIRALDKFENKLLGVLTREDFVMPGDLIERIIFSHINCRMNEDEVNNILDQEITEMRQAISEISKEIIGNNITKEVPFKLLLNIIESIPLPVIGEGGLIGLYRNEVMSLARHCLEHKLLTPEMFVSCPVSVSPAPLYLSEIRTSSSYSIHPLHPPSGGVFYVINANDPRKAVQEYQREYRMLSAHETYPGHHLLDSARLSLDSSIRRAIEQPIFYEGWACFAEDIMRQTGYFADPYDRLMLAKRRLWRSIRGKIDIGLQTGKLSIPDAARYLSETGLTADQALRSVRRYLLNPGYQLCYTLGLRSFMHLFDTYGYNNNIQLFVRMVLSQGEINFADLEAVLKLSRE
jgi:uncharacterized protein (DUF885 family)